MLSELVDADYMSHSALLDPVTVLSAYIVSSEKKVGPSSGFTPE